MLHPPFRAMVVSRSQMGKTTLMVKMFQFYWLKQFGRVVIFCPTYTKDDKWREIDKFVKGGRVKVIPVVKTDIVQKEWFKWTSELQRECVKKGLPDQCLFFFDDCAGQPDFKINSEQGILNRLVSRGNHDQISSIWVVQKFTQASTIMRTNAEGLFTFYMQSDNELKKVWEEFGFGKFTAFKEWLHKCTGEKYHFLYMNRQGAGKADYYHNFKFVAT